MIDKTLTKLRKIGFLVIVCLLIVSAVLNVWQYNKIVRARQMMSTIEEINDTAWINAIGSARMSEQIPPNSEDGRRLRNLMYTNPDPKHMLRVRILLGVSKPEELCPALKK